MLDYLIIYEHKSREFENICLLCSEIRRRGYSVEIASVKSLCNSKYRFKNRPTVVVTYALYNNLSFDWNVGNIVGIPKKLVNLQWEQVGASIGIEQSTPKEDARNAVHICWGNESYNRLINAGLKKVFLTGALQMDFLKFPLIQFFMSKEEIIKKYNLPKGKMILYISSFSLTNLKEKGISLLRKMGKTDLDKHIEISEKTKTTMLEWFDKYLEEVPDEYIVYRPHPAEIIDKNLIELSKKHNRFYIISDETVKQWIIVSDKIITWESTSISEIFYAKKKCFIVRPFEIPEHLDIAIYKYAKIISGFEEMKEELKKNGTDFPIPEEEIIKYFGSGDLAYLKIVDVLEDVYNSDEYNYLATKKKLYISHYIKDKIKICIEQLGIKSYKFPFKKVSWIRKNLDYFEQARRKQMQEEVSQADVENTIKHITAIIESS